MADADYGEYGDYPAGTGTGRRQMIVNMAGALGSVVLVVSLVYWGYELAMRDVRGVPVVRALDGPMRMAPEDPGGAVIDHQGLAVNDVAARDGGSVSDRVVLAPAPVELTVEDIPGLQQAAALAQPQIQSDGTVGDLRESPAPVESADIDTARSIDPGSLVPVIAGGQEAAVDAALLEALGQMDAPPAPAGALTRSLRPQPRPGNGATPARASSAAAVATPVSFTDAASLAIGTRMVQFGAFETEAMAQAEWNRVSAQLGPLMGGKAPVLQAAESGGSNFWRLRATGFENEDDARRFCAAAEADGVRCIPVVQR